MTQESSDVAKARPQQGKLRIWVMWKDKVAAKASGGRLNVEQEEQRWASDS